MPTAVRWLKPVQLLLCFVFNVPPTAKVIMKTGPQLKISSDRLVKPKVEPATPGLKGKRIIHYTTAAQPVKYFTDPSKAILLLWIFMFFSVLYLSCLCMRLSICTLWSPAGKGLTSWLLFVVLTVCLSLSHWYHG